MTTIKIKRIAITMLLLACTRGSFDQGSTQEKQYTQQREAARIKSANEASIKQNAYNNRPTDNNRYTPSGTSATPAGGNSGMTVAEKVRQNAIDKQAWQRKEAEERAFAAVKSAERETREEPIKAYYRETGYFDKDDISQLMDITIDNAGGRLSTTDHALQIPNFYTTYLSRAETGTFDELNNDILNFRWVNSKAQPALDKLAARFPAKKSALVKTQLQVWEDGGFDFNKPNYNEDLVNLFYAYPEETKDALQMRRLDIIFHYAIRNRQQGTVPNTDILKLERSYAALAQTHKVKFCVFEEKNKSILEEYLGVATEDDIKALAQKTGYSAAHVIMRSYGDDIFYSRFYIGSSYLKNAKDFITPHQAALIKSFALAGDAECGAIYGLRIAQGWTDEEPGNALPWFQKAVDNKTPKAQENLNKICVYKIKTLKAYCKSVN